MSEQAIAVLRHISHGETILQGLATTRGAIRDAERHIARAEEDSRRARLQKQQWQFSEQDWLRSAQHFERSQPASAKGDV